MFLLATAQNNQLVAIGNAKDIIKIFFVTKEDEKTNISCQAVICLHQDIQLYNTEKLLTLLNTLYPIERIAGPADGWQKYHGWKWPEYIVKWDDIKDFELTHNNKYDFSLLRPTEQEKQ